MTHRLNWRYHHFDQAVSFTLNKLSAMKQYIYSLLLLVIISPVYGTILTVSNNAAYPAQFASVTAGIAAASDGDTIYIYPSYYNENVTMGKKLILIGAGLNPQRPSKTGTYIQNFTINSIAANGSVLMGIGFVTPVNANVAAVSNLIISDCYMGANGGSADFAGSNILIENCYIKCNLRFVTYNVSNIIIQNCVFDGGIALRPGIPAIIRNNIFAGSDPNNKAFQDEQYGEAWSPSVSIENNIFFKTNPIGDRGASDACTFKNNIYWQTLNPTPANVLSSGNVNADPQFVNYPAGGSAFSFNYDYHLKTGSPGINYGTDGKDVGMWGGPVPINAGFEPPIPRIYDLKAANATVPVGGTLQLTIKATKAQ